MPAPDRGPSPWKPIVTIAFGIFVVALVLAHSNLINGSWYWRWPWRDRASLSALRFYPAMLLCAGPMIVAWFFSNRARVAIPLVAISVFAMKIMSLAIITQPMSLRMLDVIVRSPDAMSYYTDAAAMPAGFLRDYAEILTVPQLNLHTKSKPPGAVVYFRAFGFHDNSPAIAGIVLAAIVAFSVPAIFWLVRLLTGNQLAALVASFLLALCPGYILIFPTFDACYSIFACAMIGFWHLTLKKNDWRFAIVFGVSLALACFFTYNLLVMGAFLLAWTIITQKNISIIIKLTSIAIFTVIFAYAIFWLIAGFDPIATFRVAYHNQQTLLAQHKADRPYPWTILFDLTDFALGAGWVIVPVIGFAIAHRIFGKKKNNLLIAICLATPILVAILGILQSETARAWNFMLPLLILPAALELSRWPMWAQRATFTVMLVVLLVIGHNMIFMVP